MFLFTAPRFYFYGAIVVNYFPGCMWGKVIFLHLSVILFTEGGGLAYCMVGYPPSPPRPEAGTPPPGIRQPPWEQAPPPLGAGTPPEQTPPSAVHAGRYEQQAGGTHPTGMQSVSVSVLDCVDEPLHIFYL